MKCRDCNVEISDKRKCGLCKICYARDYRKRNKDKIRPVKHKQYLRRKDYWLEQTKKWVKENPKKMKKIKDEEYRRHKRKQIVRVKTRLHFGYLKENGQCDFCGKSEDLEFHHEEPYKFDKFKLLCKKCHRFLRNKEFMDKFVKSEKNEVEDGKN